jgi:tetratricopeptide (TPR) repeat protein
MQNCRGSAAELPGKGRLKSIFLLCSAGLTLLGNCLIWRANVLDGHGQGRIQTPVFEYSEKSDVTEIRNLRESGLYPEARRKAEDFLSKRSGSAVLHMELGRILSEIGDYREAEKHLRDAITFASSASAIRMQATRELGDLLEDTGRKGEARLVWDQLLNRYRGGGLNGSQALGIAAVAAWRRGYAQDAKDIFMDATDPKLGEVSPDVLADFGDLFLEKYNATEAIGVFRDCLKLDKSHARALVGIARAKKYDGDFEVEAYAGAALKVNPNFGPAWNVLAQLAIEEEDYGEALKRTNAALSVNPANLESLALQAFCRYVQGDVPGFSDIEKRVLAINPSYGRFYHILADNLVSRRKYQEAADWSRRALALDPELWAAYVTLGMNLMRVGDQAEGRKAIQRAFEGDPFNIWAYNSLNLFDQMDTFTRIQGERFAFLMSKEDVPALSPYASELAEEAYSKLTAKYGFKPSGPIQVEILPDHGGFAIRTLGLPGLSGALGVCFGKVLAIDSPRAREKRSFNWGSTLWHEFVHVMTLQMTKYNIPRWYTEGLSVYEEQRARPGWGDTLTGEFLLAYKSGKLMKASELNAGFVRPNHPGQIMLAYYQAGLVCEMIEELYGFEKIRHSLLLFAENKPAEEVFRQTLGLDTAQMDAAYAKFLDSRFGELSLRMDFAGPESGGGGKAVETPDKKSLLRQLETSPDSFAANLQLGRLLRKEGANAEAEVRLKKAQQVFPQYIEKGNPYELLGEIYLESKREEDALAQFTRWSQADGNAHVPLLKAAEIYRSRKDWASAAEMLKRSVFIDPYDREVQKKLGEAAMECGKWPLAVAAYRALADSNAPDPAGAYYELARALLAAGNNKEARREVLRSLEIAPSYRQAQELLLRLSGDSK